MLKSWTQRKTKEWYEAIQAMMNGSAAKDYIEKNRYDSFAPVRPNSYVNWCVSHYMLCFVESLRQNVSLIKAVCKWQHF